MEIHQKAKLVVAGLALLVSAPLLAGEKVQITGSTSVQLPKPSHVLEDSRNARTHDGPSGRSEYEGGLPQMNPHLSPSPRMDKKFMDALDKKKNWIFVNPYEMQFDSKTEEFLKGEKGTGLYNHPLMKGDEKGVVERFIDEKKPNRETESDRTGLNSRDNQDDRDSDPNDLRGNTGLEEMSGEKPDSANLRRGLVLPSPLEQKSLLLTERNSFQEKLERSPFSGGAFGSDSPRENERSIYTPEERAARDAELSKIYQPRVGGAPLAAAVDPLNHSFDATRQETTPFSGRRTEQLFNVGRSQPGGSAAGRNSPIFTGPPIGGAGGGLNARLPDRNGFDINARASQPSSFAPSAAAVAPARSSSPLLNSTPFVLPIPQRKF